MHVGFGSCSFGEILHVGGHLSHARLAFQTALVLLSCCLSAIIVWAFFFYHGGHSFVREGLQLIWGERKGNGKLPEQLSCILCPHEDFPFFPHTCRSISFSNGHHPLFPLVPCIPGCCYLISYFCCRCLCMLLNLSLGKRCPSPDSHSFHCLCSWPHFQLWSGQPGRRGAGFRSQVTVEHCLPALPRQLFWAGEVLLHPHRPPVVFCQVYLC